MADAGRMGDLADQSSYDPFAAEQFVNPVVDAMGRGLSGASGEWRLAPADASRTRIRKAEINQKTPTPQSLRPGTTTSVTRARLTGVVTRRSAWLDRLVLLAAWKAPHSAPASPRHRRLRST